ncbi:hypothetical protein [Allokutzneria albata]|uniref:Uncharacterized protein n=1 Tax=Allokutzneria albata TaxID=211114 RepID=A0A1H0CBM0_ALLAB|nr:hypothetical protein [Allokutzneria albata]SDN55232.1 hypothetical protein SAMN04489726_7130 [Allokutzneria albata]
MANPVERALTDLDIGMRNLKTRIKAIPVRREGFKKLHDDFARLAAELSVEMRYAQKRLRS